MSDDEANFRGQVTQKAVLQGPDNRVLLVRSGENRPWSIPGGRIQADEDADAALARELREETGLSATVGPPVATMTGLWHTGDGEPMFTVVYACETEERGVSLNHEHNSFRWVTPERAADRLPVKSLRTAVQRATRYDR